MLQRPMRSALLLTAFALGLLGTTDAQPRGAAPAAGRGSAPGEVIVGFEKGMSDQAVRRLQARFGAVTIREFPQLDARVMRLSRAGVGRLALHFMGRERGVRYVEPNYIRRVLLPPPNDPAYNNLDTMIAPFGEDADPTHFQWGLHKIEALGAWSIYPGMYYTAATKPANAPKIGVIDTGIDIGGADGIPHPEFINAGGTSPDAAEGGQVDMAHGRNVLAGHDPDDFADDYGHGTAVAAVFGAATNDGGSPPGDGIAGLAYHCQILPVKALDSMGYGTEADLAAGILWAVDHGALIVNVSAGGYDYSQLGQDAVNYAWEKGTLVVAAAGNDGESKRVYPASSSGAMAVGATTWPDDWPASYSNYGEFVEISAPGGDQSLVPLAFWGIWTAMPTEPVPLHDAGWEPGVAEYQYHFGTSLAAPFVAGLASLYAASRGITQDTPGGVMEIWQALQRGCDNAGNVVGWSPYWGWGRINAHQTLLGNDNRGSSLGCITGQILYYGTVIANASVQATPVGGGSSHGATSRSDGTFRISNIDPGYYNVQATIYGKTGHYNNVLVTASADRPRVHINVPGLTVTSITPDSAAAGTVVETAEITGSGFEAGATVKLATSGHSDIVGADVTVVSSTQITCDFDLDGAAPGLRDVVVTNPGGESGTLADGFEITQPAPVVLAIVPDSGMNDAPVDVEITGDHFRDGATTRLTRDGEDDIVGTSVIVVSSTEITCTFDITGAAIGAWNVVVTNDDDQSGQLDDGFEVLQADTSPPYITGWDIRVTHGYGVGEVVTSIGDGHVEPRLCGIGGAGYGGAPTVLHVHFSEPLDPATVDTDSITIVGVRNGDCSHHVSSLTLQGDGDEVRIEFNSALPDQDTYTITLSEDICDPAGNPLWGERSIEVVALIGDANSSRTVTAGDMLAVRTHIGWALNADTARYDINLSGTITAGDMLAIRPYIGNNAP